MNDVKPLDENDSYVLLLENEDIFLFDKELSTEVWRTSMYGNATCGLLGLVSGWAVIGGEHLVIWVENKLYEISVPELMWVHDLRQVGDYEIEILIDPWHEKSAIWKFNLKTFSKSKVQDFKEYYDKPFQEAINW